MMSWTIQSTTKAVAIFSATVCLYQCTPVVKNPETPKNNYTLWYNTPAKNWNEALPLGNGRLGVMVFGNPAQEELQLNEDTIWAGGPNNNINPAAKDALEKVSQLIFEERYVEAQTLANEKVRSTNNGMPYQTVGSLTLSFANHDQFTDYYRDLDIEKAVSTVRYQHDGVTFTRETFSSFTDDVVVVRLSADKPGSITTTIGFNSPMQHEVSTEANRLRIDGRGSNHEGVEGKVRFTTLVEADLSGGTLNASGQQLAVTNANTVTLRISTGTNVVSYKDLSANAPQKALQKLQAAEKNYVTARTRHSETYQSWFHRVSMDLGTSPAFDLPTNERIEKFASHYDPHMVMLYFQYGRYLLISSSQPGTQPANLQGIWNPHTNPPWDSKYTININTQMNYWPAELTNLSELHQPLFDMLEDLSVTGQQSASQLYGVNGWMTHHNTDQWRITGQVDAPFYGQWQTGGAWLSQHIWYRYLFTGDKTFLQKYYPVLREAARFHAESLRKDPKTGWLVQVPSNSPENTYVHGDVPVSISAGTTMDNQIIFDLFSAVIDAANVLNDQDSLIQELIVKRDQLAPMQIGSFGQLQEWLHDWDDPEDHHRHISHLYGLYPSNQISPFRTPELLEAARVSLNHRGDKSTGWSMGWKINWWARLLDGNRAWKLLEEQIHLTEEVIAKTEKGGTYANMLDAHPPFQIDGNFGVTSGVAEMLVQSHDGFIYLLPALPDALPNGEVKGLNVRGGFVVDIRWREGKVTDFTLHAKHGGNARIRSAVPLVQTSGTGLEPASGENPNAIFATPELKPFIVNKRGGLGDSQPLANNDYLYDLATEPGKSWSFKNRP